MTRPRGSNCTGVKANNVFRAQAWQTMRIMRRFTRADVLTTTQTERSNLTKYIRALLDFGFLSIDSRRSGAAGSRDVLRMARDNGPLPPLLHTDGSMTDPNTGDCWHFINELAEQCDPKHEIQPGNQMIYTDTTPSRSNLGEKLTLNDRHQPCEDALRWSVLQVLNIPDCGLFVTTLLSILKVSFATVSSESLIQSLQFLEKNQVVHIERRGPGSHLGWSLTLTREGKDIATYKSEPTFTLARPILL